MDLSLALALVVLAAFAYGLWRANELFVVRATRGRIELVRGRCPQRLLNDFGDVMKRFGGSVRVRATVEGGRPMLRVLRGEIDPARLQRLRNVTGTWTVAQIRSAPRKREG